MRAGCDKRIFRRLRNLEEAQRLCSAANEGTPYKELLRARLESLGETGEAMRVDPTWGEPTPEEDLAGSLRLSAFFAARGWHKVAQAVLGSGSEEP